MPRIALHKARAAIGALKKYLPPIQERFGLTSAAPFYCASVGGQGVSECRDAALRGMR